MLSKQTSWGYILVFVWSLFSLSTTSFERFSYRKSFWHQKRRSTQTSRLVSIRAASGDPDDSAVGFSRQLIEYQLLLAVESLDYHSAAVYIPCTEERDFVSASGGSEAVDNSMKLLCEYTCPTYQNQPTGKISTFDIITEGTVAQKVGLLVFAESEAADDDQREIIDEKDHDNLSGEENAKEQVEVVDDAPLLHKRERLLGGSLSSIRLILQALNTQSVSTNSNSEGSNRVHDETYIADEASSMIITLRTLLKMVSRRLSKSDEIGLELLDNVNVQLDSLSALISKRTFKAESTPISPVSTIMAELASDIDHGQNLPLNIVSYNDEKGLNSSDTTICETTAKSTNMREKRTTVSRVDDEFWSASKQEIVIEINDESDVKPSEIDVEVVECQEDHANKLEGDDDEDDRL